MAKEYFLTQKTNTYSSTQETTNFARIVRCIIGPCTEMLRDLLASEISPDRIKDVVRKALDIRKDLSHFQKEKLCFQKNMHMDPNYKKFDISLMYLLFRTEGICCNIEKPSKGWGKPPRTANENTMGDDIERLRVLKDDICSHLNFPAIQTPKYCDKMRELKSVCSRFDQMLGKNYYYECICKIENEVMDPEMSKMCAEMMRIVHELEEKDIVKDNRLMDVEAKVKDQSNAYYKLENSFYDLLNKVNTQQTQDEDSSVIRPANPLYPESILTRADDIKIKQNYSYLLEAINPVSILSKVHDKGIITTNIQEEISECNRKKHKTDRILKSLLRSSPQHYASFVAVLQDPDIDCSHIVEKLESTVVTENEITDDCLLIESKCRIISNSRRIRDVVNTDDIIHYFLEKEILHLDEHSDVFCEYMQRRHRIEYLLKHVKAYLPWSYQIFLESLEKHNHYQLLVKQIEDTDVKQVQKERESLEVIDIDITPTGEVAIDTETYIEFNFEAENSNQIKDEILSGKNALQTEETPTKKFHGYIEKVERGCIKITLSAASRLFWSKLKAACENGEIGDFVIEILEMENVNLSLFPEQFSIDFLININPPHALPNTARDIRGDEIRRNLLDCYNILSEEIDCNMILDSLEKCGVINSENIYGNQEEKLKNLLLHLNEQDEDVFQGFIEVLENAGYSYIAKVLLEKDLHAFNNLSDDDIRLVIIENYTLLLDELYLDRLMQSSSQLKSVASSIIQESNGERRNGIHRLLKRILQGDDILPRVFLKSLNYAGYDQVLHLMAEKLKDTSYALSNTTDGSGTAPERVTYRGKMTVRKKGPILSEASIASESESTFQDNPEHSLTWKNIHFTSSTIRDNYKELARELPAEEVADLLLGYRVFNYDEHRNIMTLEPRQKKAEEILNKVLGKTEQSQQLFVNILQQIHHDTLTISHRQHTAFDFDTTEECDSGTSSMYTSDIAVEDDVRSIVTMDSCDLRITEDGGESVVTVESSDCGILAEKRPEETIKKTKHSHRLLCGAIDFGTTFSTYAFSLKGRHRPIFFPRWQGDHLQSMKTLTCLLFNSKNEFDSFGYDAENKYCELCDDGEENEWYYFKHFKMKLHSKEHPLKRDSLLTEVGGKQLSAMLVFSTSIRYLKDHLLREKDKQCFAIKDENITWVLTVPAIWDAEAKQFMREAAEEAGIPGEQLVIALEPEAASVFVKEINTQKQVTEEYGLSPYAPGTKFMVLDLGGGTVDMTVREVMQDRTLKELNSACGNNFGGNTINAKFDDFIKNLVGVDIMEEFARTEKADAYSLGKEIETRKRILGSDISVGKTTISLPGGLLKLYEERKGKHLSTQSDINRAVIMKNGKLKIEIKILKDFFTDIENSIVSYIKDILSNDIAADLKDVILVGGFADCSVIKNSIRTIFPGLRFVIPNEAGLAVVKGAVLYGHDPTVVSARVSRYTIGTAVHRHFLDTDDPSKKTEIDGTIYCRDVFNKLVEIGQTVMVKEKVVTKVFPLTANMKQMTIKLYKSTEKDPKYVTDSDCTYLGKTTVNMPDTPEGLERCVKLSLEFGQTEITITGKDSSTDSPVTVSLDMLS